LHETWLIKFYGTLFDTYSLMTPYGLTYVGILSAIILYKYLRNNMVGAFVDWMSWNV